MEEDKKEFGTFKEEPDTGKIEPDYTYDFSFDKKIENPYFNEIKEEPKEVFEDTSMFKAQDNNEIEKESLLTSQKMDYESPYIKEEQTPLYTTEKETKENYTSSMESVDMELNRENIMEEALSHTTKYSPFVLPKEEEKEEVENENKGSIVFIIVLFAILFLAVLLIPKISTWF